MSEECEICKNASQIIWRLGALEGKVNNLEKILIGTLITSISTLIGVVLQLATAAN